MGRIRGQTELIRGPEHLQRVIREGVLAAKVSLDIATADLKAVMVPDNHGQTRSLVHLLRQRAERGVEVRVLHSGVPSGPARQELRGRLPQTLRIRRCPRVHTKVVIVDSRAMYLGSANLTGAGLGAKAADKRNFELGVWTESPDLIDGAAAEFNGDLGRPVVRNLRQTGCVPGTVGGARPVARKCGHVANRIKPVSGRGFSGGG